MCYLFYIAADCRCRLYCLPQCPSLFIILTSDTAMLFYPRLLILLSEYCSFFMMKIIYPILMTAVIPFIYVIFLLLLNFDSFSYPHFIGIYSFYYTRFFKNTLFL